MATSDMSAREKRAFQNYDEAKMNRIYNRFYRPLKYNINAMIANRDYDGVHDLFVQNNDMAFLERQAYLSKRGYSIGYVHGKKVLYVSGSRNFTDWVFNAADDIIPARFHHVSNTTAKKLTRIAKREGVDVVVGHSRGAMLVAKMDIPDNKKLGLDGALRLAPANRRDMMNLYQDQLLDKFISRRGTNKKKYKLGNPWRYHFITRDWKGYDDTWVPRRYQKRRKIGRHKYTYDG